MQKRSNQDGHMTATELRATWGLGAVFSLRMLGMFMVLPVLTTYGMALHGASEILIGVAIGIYGLMQAVFQIPFGLWSDKFGRKPLIVFGLLIFVAGSVLAAMSGSIWGVILGRALQGAGAIAAAVMALLSDLTREQNRTKAMAFIGISFGITFAIAMVLGPILTHIVGLQGLFWFIAALASIGILLTIFMIPGAPQHTLNRESAIVRGGFKTVLANGQLVKLNISIFCMHLLLMATFIALPSQLEQAGLPAADHWQIYLGTMLIAFVCVLPGIILAEVKRRMRTVFIICVAILMVAEWTLWQSGHHFWIVVFGTQLFFIAFNLLEALLPSLVSKEAPAGYKGTAMGMYSTSQFLGVATGGSMGGWLAGHFGMTHVFWVGLLVSVAWLLFSFTLNEPPYLASLRLVLHEPTKDADALRTFLQQCPGVEDVVIEPQEQSAYVKIDRKITNREALELALAQFSNTHPH